MSSAINILSSAVLLAASSLGTALAGTVDLVIQGSITQVQNSGGSSAAPARVGDPVRVTFSYDPATTPTQVSHGFYGGTFQTYSFNPGSASVTFSTGTTQFKVTDRITASTAYASPGGGCAGFLAYGSHGSLGFSGTGSAGGSLIGSFFVFTTPVTIGGPYPIDPPLLRSPNLPASMADIGLLTPPPSQSIGGGCPGAQAGYTTSVTVNGWSISAALDSSTLTIGSSIAIAFGRPSIAVSRPSPGATKLVAVVHGWNSDTRSPWVADMIDRICKRLGSTSQISDPAHPEIPAPGCNAGTWDVRSIDWGEAAGSVEFVPDCLLATPSSGSTPPTCPLVPGTSSLPTVLFSTAWAQARAVGESLADTIQQGAYQHVHLIAHSAGSNVAQSAVDKLMNITYPANGGCPRPQPSAASSLQSIHLTFLDAYDPGGQSSRYGCGATWAEQYVDTRPLVFNLLGLDTTNTKLPFAFNFDVTSLDTRVEPIYPDWIMRHAWPIDYYACSVLVPPFTPASLPDGARCSMVAPDDITGFGFSLSAGAGTGFAINAQKYPIGSTDGTAHWCAHPLNVTCPTFNSTIGTAVFSPFFPVITGTLAISPTGAAQTTPSAIDGTQLNALQVALSTGSPAWISLPFQTQDRLDAIQIDVGFISRAEGLLSVAVDGKLVQMIDERFFGTQSRTTAQIPVGPLAAGSHWITIRLDSFSQAQSRVIVGNIRSYRIDSNQVAIPVGDLNSDGKIDCRDIAIVKNSFGKKRGLLGFDARADINSDGIVDVRDLAFVSQKLPTATKCP